MKNSSCTRTLLGPVRPVGRIRPATGKPQPVRPLTDTGQTGLPILVVNNTLTITPIVLRSFVLYSCHCWPPNSEYTCHSVTPSFKPRMRSASVCIMQQWTLVPLIHVLWECWREAEGKTWCVFGVQARQRLPSAFVEALTKLAQAIIQKVLFISFLPLLTWEASCWDLYVLLAKLYTQWLNLHAFGDSNEHS